MASEQRVRRSRGNGEGSIYQRSDGKWCAAVSLDQGKRKVLYGKTRQEVAAKLRKAQVNRDNGLPPVPERQTLGQFLDRWLEDTVKPQVRPQTYASYRRLVNLHIKPSLGKRPLAKLTPQDIQHWRNEKLATGRIAKRTGDEEGRPAGLSPRTVQYLRAILRRALGQAHR